MMMVRYTVDELRRALEHSNVQAWLRLIRHGETHADDDDAYFALYGWRPGSGENRFASLLTHPRTPRRVADGSGRWTSAAGAYQFMAEIPGYTRIDTWGECCRWFDERDYVLTFSREDQGLFAVWCTARRGALPAVIAGQITLAMHMCRQEWASLPEAPYGQPTRNAAELLAVYRSHGGTLADSEAEAPPPAPAPVQPQPSPTQPPEEVLAMPAPIAAAVLGGLASTVIDAFVQPKLKAELQRHAAPEVAERLTTAVIDATKQVAGLPDPVAAVRQAKVEQVERIVAADLERLAPLLDRIAELDRQRLAADTASHDAAEARARGAARDQDPLLTRAIIAMMIGLMALLCAAWIVLALNGVDTGPLSGTVLALAGVVGAKFSTRYDHRYGSSAGSALKDGERDALIRRLSGGGARP